MKRPEAGYTILEALIFLAVSALLFAAIYPTWSGRQKRIEFTQAVYDLESKINDVANDVSTGYYPSDEFQCNSAGNSGNITFPVAVGQEPEQGTRDECVFLGKALHFNNNPNNATMNIITVVGNKIIPGQILTSYPDLNPTAVAKDTGSADRNRDITEKYNLSWGAFVSKVIVIGSPSGTQIGTFGLLTPLTNDSVDGTSGANIKQVNVVPVKNSSYNSDDETAAKKINQNNSFDDINPAEGILLCIDTVTDNNLKAAILVGGDAGIGKTKVTISEPNVTQEYGTRCD